MERTQQGQQRDLQLLEIIQLGPWSPQELISARVIEGMGNQDTQNHPLSWAGVCPKCPKSLDFLVL